MKRKKRNTEFFRNKIKYNAIRTFKNNIIKIPSYIIDYIFLNKMSIEIYHKDKYITTYTYDNLHSYIVTKETKVYNGKFEDKDITYNLTHVEI